MMGNLFLIAQRAISVKSLESLTQNRVKRLVPVHITIVRMVVTG